MKYKIISYFFDAWWLPLLCFGFTLVLFIAGAFTASDLFQNISVVIYFVGMGVLFLSTVYQLLEKRWIRGIVTGLVFGASVAGFMLFTLMLFVKGVTDGDKWADNLKIPTDIPLHYPKGNYYSYPDSDTSGNIDRSQMDLELYHSYQPGMYYYDFWTGKRASGTIYLKAFEITKNYPLSEERLEKNSALKIHNPSDSIRRFGSQDHFTIYEGDWGKPYAARFEVWFRPAAGEDEQKLFEKNFVIEGWQH